MNELKFADNIFVFTFLFSEKIKDKELPIPQRGKMENFTERASATELIAFLNPINHL